MLIDTPYGKAEVPDNYANEYKDKTDIELIEILLSQNKGFLDPILVQICIDKNLLKKGEAVEDLEMKLDDMKLQEYDKLKAENERLKDQLSIATMYHGCDILIAELQQQLKEKDEEIEKLKEEMHKMMPYEDCQEFESYITQKIKKEYEQQFKENLEKLQKTNTH